MQSPRLEFGAGSFYGRRLTRARVLSGRMPYAPGLFFRVGNSDRVSEEERRYNPMSYTNLSAWPHDNAIIALGFARYGLQGSIERVFKGMFDAATYMDIDRLPELFCGFRRRRGRGPTLYPVACAPQAWAAATPFALLQASLGLSFNPARNEIRLINPRLPSFLDEVSCVSFVLEIPASTSPSVVTTGRFPCGCCGGKDSSV